MSTERSRRPSSHRRRGGLRARRPILAFLIAGFLIIGAFAATGIAWDPFGPAEAGHARSAVPRIGEPWSAGPSASGRTGSPSPGTGSTTGPAVPGTGDGKDKTRPGKPAHPGGSWKPTAALPFDLPAPATLRRGGKLVFAHYFTPYPLSLDNRPAQVDYYTRNYLNPAGESGKHARYGGLLRDRPLPTAPKSGDWEYANLQQEVRTARAAGLDGFTVDLLSLSGKNWERTNLLMRAAHSVDPDFHIMAMPDMTSINPDPATLADALAKLAASPAAHRLGDGRLVVSPFKAEAKTPAWWSQVIDTLRSRHGIRTALVPLFLDYGAHSGEFAPISYGFSEWGSRSYVGQESATRDVKRAHSLGKIWMQPVSVQDARPNQGVYDEAGNTATLRATWKHAIDDGADWVQMTTWNDYSEGSQFAPSLHNGHTYLDLSSYYLTRFKTGSWPQIVRDTVYLTSRVQFAAADPTGNQKLLMAPRRGTAPPRDKVEVLSFLTAPATVRATVGGVPSTYRAEAGPHAELFPLRTGGSSVLATRGGKPVAAVGLGYEAEAVVAVQDLQYYAATSGRD
ncbi:glycoside hydrolase family 71 protein [Streptomyces sp. NPDC089919]|uniref:glycoside hydrolase family 71 protein n=1 Tax=Streptomyces sp. NPDC089919 TaxID=3155188 RepID=UPI0034319CE4